jgi:cytochrome c peroxidase
VIVNGEDRVLRLRWPDDPTAEVRLDVSSPPVAALLQDERIFAVLAEGLLVELELDGGKATLKRQVPAGVEPTAVASNGDRLAVVDRAAQSLLVFSADLTRDRSYPLSRSPSAVSIYGQTALVTHASLGKLSFVNLVNHEIHVVDFHVARSDLPKGFGELPLLQNKAISVTQDGWLVASVSSATGDTTVRSKDGYGQLHAQRLSASMLHLLNVKPDGSYKEIDRDLLADAGLLPAACLLPVTLAIDQIDQSVLLLCEGPSRLYKIDLVGRAKKAKRAWEVPYALPEGAASLTLIGREAWVWSSDENALTRLPVDVATRFDESPLAIGGRAAVPNPTATLRGKPRERDERIRQGRLLFHTTSNPAVSADGRACANCHINGYDDGLTWPTPEGPRQTPVLAGRVADTPPYGWTGKRRTIPLHLKDTIHRLGGAGITAAQADALAAYVTSLAAPRPKRSANDDQVIAGREVFESKRAGCTTCHVGKRFVDGALHNVKSAVKKLDVTKAFDTPSLRGLSHSAPYYHDGRFASLDALLRGVDGSMGHTAHLTEVERAALVAYLESL